MYYEHKSYKYLYYTLIGFNLLTLVVYISNPFWKGTGYHGLTILYIAFNLILFAVGYKKGLQKGSRYNYLSRNSFLSALSNKNLNYYIIFYLLTFLLKYAYELHVPAFNISALIQRIALGVANPYLGYTTGGSYRPFAWSLYILICLFDSVFFIVGLLSWRKLKRGGKALLVVLSVIELLKGLGSGASFGEIKMITTVAVILIINIKGGSKLTNKQKLLIIISILAAFGFAVFIFGHNMAGRSGGELSDNLGYSLDFNEDSFVNKYIISIFPRVIQNLYVYISNYLVQGYYHLECAFLVDYDWTWFCGSNDAKTLMLNILTGFDVEPLNYQTKIFQQFGIDPYIAWHSCYLWIANDVTLFGVPLVLFMVGKIIGTSIVLFRRFNDLLSGTICVIFANMIIFLFANNNYIANLFYSFLLLFPIWFFTRYTRLNNQ